MKRIMNNEEALRRKRVKKIHNFSTWVRRMPKKAMGFNVNFSISKRDFSDLKDLLDWELLRKKFVKIGRPGCKCIEYMWRNPKPEKEEELVLIQIIECDSYLNTHESIIDFMMSCTLPKFPAGKEVGLDIGDLCFGSYEKIPVAIVFARDNLMVYVRSVGKDNVSVKEVATKIDRMIRWGLEVKPKIKVSRKEIRKISAIKKIIRVGDKLLLTIAGYDLKNEKLKYRVIAPGGQILRDNARLYYRAEKLGRHQISIFIFDENNNLITSVEYGIAVKK